MYIPHTITVFANHPPRRIMQDIETCSHPKSLPRAPSSVWLEVLFICPPIVAELAQVVVTALTEPLRTRLVGKIVNRRYIVSIFM